jgi:Zn-dependent protease
LLLFDFDLRQTLLTLPAILFGLCFHEFSHGYAAYKLGDPTPKEQGRLTLNPLTHVDPIGFLLLLIAHFGWAKPVQINPEAFKHPKRDEILVALAGPAANLLTAFVFAVLVKLAIDLRWYAIPTYGAPLMTILIYFIQINLVLAFFNLLPFPPLDGSHLFMVLLPDRWQSLKWNLYRYGSLFLLVIILLQYYTPIHLLQPLSAAVQAVYKGFFQLLGVR